MTVPALPYDDGDDGYHEGCVDGEPHLRRLADYEPDDLDEPPRWSSLRPVPDVQLELVAEPGETPVRESTLWELVRRMLEVLDGRRPIGQLHRLLPGPAFEALLTRLRITRPGTRHRLMRLRPGFPTPDAVEVAAVIEVTYPGGRTRVIAAAARFDRHGDWWPCTALRLI